ncbi:HD domain-containing protein [Oceanobacillus piezotolerans]|uniref:HD domain-containing protein n=1 Tax=Oceanobacillus piezotolerans TaxID=2448030 RepID=A0A498DDE7_9BACI|nr:HD domain-containing protein [Oceanobacillus piezotolerans]RLL45004.1 HD domain-containing protein [Oceanobacillus piezotolerans]
MDSYFYNIIPIRITITEEERTKILEQYPTPNLPASEEHFQMDREAHGSFVEIRVLLNDYQVQQTKTNKQYLKIRFSNNAGSLNAKMWDNQGAVERTLPILEQHSVFDISAKVEEFNGFKSLTIERISPCTEEINPFSLLPYTQQDMESLTVELFSYLYELQGAYRELSLSAMNRFWKQFSIRPAAKGFHHNYLGGLLKHTVGLMRFARYILKFEENHFKATMKLIQVVEKAHKKELWNAIEKDEKQFVWKDTIDHLYQMFYGMMQHKDTTPNYDLLITSILFHDIGKLLEYDHAGKTFDGFSFLYPTATDESTSIRKQAGITMDELGVMIGHIPYGVLLLTKLIEIENLTFSLEEIHQLSHCILCHHGLPEWGSAVRSPLTVEGYLIHIVDYLDSRYENTEAIK